MQPRAQLVAVRCARRGVTDSVPSSLNLPEASGQRREEIFYAVSEVARLWLLLETPCWRSYWSGCCILDDVFCVWT
jgi:hypothetical protein